MDLELKATCGRCGKECLAIVKGPVAMLAVDNCEHLTELWPKSRLYAFVEVTRLKPEEEGVQS